TLDGATPLSADERLFALGTRTLADLIAPAGAEVRRDHLQLDVHYLRVLVVTGYPRTVAAGWLAPLVEELDLPLELSLHIRPLASRCPSRSARFVAASPKDGIGSWSPATWTPARSRSRCRWRAPRW